MLPLDKKYLAEADELASAIQESEELATFLEEEEEEFYDQMKELYEPYANELHDKVARENPLQLIALEQRMMKEDYEGLFLPRMLGYSVLRGEVNDQFKYVRSQDHFRDLLIALCESPHFEVLKKRIGQSIQVGFALSSDIWITSLIASFENKRIRYFLQAQKIDRYRDVDGRVDGYKIFKRQFINFNYMTADFPKNLGELKVSWNPVKEFLLYRIERKLNNSSVQPFLKSFVEHQDFKGHNEHLQIMGLYALFFEMNETDAAHLFKHFNETRKAKPEFAESWLNFILEIHQSKRVDLDAYADARVYNILDKKIKDSLTGYYELMATVHSSGYHTEEAMEAVKTFYNNHEGRSIINECVRMTIYHYLARLLNNLEVSDYQSLFDVSKIYTVYIGIFANEQFNISVKELSMRYVKRLLKHYTDKRGKDYQDIKRFVSSTFQDLNFLKEKEVVELFKTRRKKKVS